MTDLYDKQANISTDACWNNAKDTHNNQMYHYVLYDKSNNEESLNSANNCMLDHPNLRGRLGYGLSDRNNIDKYSSLRNDPESYTTDKCPIQLYERIFAGGPRLKGTTDISKELDILSGSSTNTYSCKKTIMEQSMNNMIPMLDIIKDIQDPDNIIPKWVNGGEDTRSYINRANYKKKCNKMEI